MTSSTVLDRPVDAAEATSATAAPQPATPSFSARDAAELAARRAADAKLEARLRGWKPLTIWYAVWALLIAFGSFSALASGQAGAGLTCLVLSAASAKYAHYLYNGGRRRVWFFIW